MQCIIITIGDELLIGQTIDTNSAWMAQRLNMLGIQVLRRIAIADDREEIIRATDEARALVPLVLLTGGLGPTADDITKPVLCEYFNGKMVINETVLRHIYKIFARTNRPVLQRNLKQAEVPDVCTVLFNRVGTAPGMWFEKEGSIVVSMPGVPFEMEAIMEDEVLPRLSNGFPLQPIVHETLIAVGMGESAIAEAIADLENALPPIMHLAYLPSPGLVKLRLTATGAGRETLQREVARHSGLIQQRLGDIVASTKDEPLEKIIVDLLREHHLTVTFAESCTGGYLAHRLTMVPGASEVFNGSIITYANIVKHAWLQVPEAVLQEQGAVSEAVVLQMARRAGEMFKADISVSVSGILGPGGGSPEKPVGLVWIALSAAQGTYARKFLFRHDRRRNKELVLHAAYDMIRKEILSWNNE